VYRHLVGCVALGYVGCGVVLSPSLSLTHQCAGWRWGGGVAPSSGVVAGRRMGRFRFSVMGLMLMVVGKGRDERWGMTWIGIRSRCCGVSVMTS
jgi:hypothetical protein